MADLDDKDNEYRCKDSWGIAVVSAKWADATICDLQAKLEAEKERRRLIEAQYARLCDAVYEEDGETLKIVAERKAREEAEQLAQRSTRRLVELSEPGFIGAFAARDAWKERAEAAEAKLREVEADYAGCKDTLKDERYCHGQTIASLKNAASEEIKAAKAATIERCENAVMVIDESADYGYNQGVEDALSVIRALAPERTKSATRHLDDARAAEQRLREIKINTAPIKNPPTPDNGHPFAYCSTTTI